MNESIIGRYWKAYGGFKALFSSVYFYTSIILSILLTPAWLNNPWHEIVISVVPNILGFSLGGYALLVAIGDENFRALISGENKEGETSPYMEVNAAFVHFILMQLLALIIALFSYSYYFKIDPSSQLALIIENLGILFDVLVILGNYIGFTVFIYAILTAAAATLSILRVSSWYDHMHTERLRLKKQNDINKK